MEENCGARYLAVDTAALKDNIEVIKNMTDAKLMAVLKNNGYGLSLVPYAKFLSENGIEFFGVTDPADALALRENGVTGEVLLLMPCLEEDIIAKLIENDIALSVSGLTQTERIKKAASNIEKTARVHIELETGFGRLGFLPEELSQADFDGLSVEGVFTHFHEPFGKKKFADRQFKKFLEGIKLLEERGINTGIKHCCASGGLLKHKDKHLDMVRAGSALVGGVHNASSYGLKPAAHLMAQIVAVKELPKGHNIGYGNICRLKKKTKVGIIMTGTAEGFMISRTQPNLGIFRKTFRAIKSIFAPEHYVEINGQKAKLLGAAGTDYFAVDLTGIQCSEGDRAKIELNFTFCPDRVKRVYL